MQRSCVISILFLRPQPVGDAWINRLTAWLGWLFHGEGFCHTEICVSYNGAQVSSSVYQGETVCLTQVKSFANPGYVVLCMAVTNQELSEIIKFMSEAHRQKVRFDATGMYLALLPVHICRSTKGKTFCSKYVTDVLQFAGIAAVQGVNSSIVTPSRLYKLLKNDPECRQMVGSVQFKQASLEHNAVI